MIVSRNELQSTTSKALLGSGIDIGRATEVARACVWLHDNGLSGSEEVLHCLRALSRAGRAPGDQSRLRKIIDSGETTVWSCGPTSAILDGVAALDLLRSAIADHVKLHRVDSPALLVGLMQSRPPQRGAGVVLQRLTVDPGGRGLVANDQPVPHGPIDSLQRGDTVELTRSWSWLHDPEHRPDAAGIEIAESSWETLSHLANLTTVPSTAGSRTHGAGAGLTDND